MIIPVTQPISCPMGDGGASRRVVTKHTSSTCQELRREAPAQALAPYLQIHSSKMGSKQSACRKIMGGYTTNNGTMDWQTILSTAQLIVKHWVSLNKRTYHIMPDIRPHNHQVYSTHLPVASSHRSKQAVSPQRFMPSLVFVSMILARVHKSWLHDSLAGRPRNPRFTKETMGFVI